MNTIPDINKDNISELKNLKAGENINYSGEVITLRDSSVNKLLENKDIIKLENKIVMYAAAVSGKKIIIGPTTSIRMDPSLEFLYNSGVIATIGKGQRSETAVRLSKKFKTPYLLCMPGVSSFLSQFFIKGKVLAFKELGPEAIHEYSVNKLPLKVGIDSSGSVFRPF